MQIGSESELKIVVQTLQWTKKHFATEQEFKEWRNANPHIEVYQPLNNDVSDLPLYKSTEATDGYYAFILEV